MPLQELHSKIDKFIIVPVCRIINEFGDQVDERQMKSIIHFVGNNIDLRELAIDLEKKVDEKFSSENKTAESTGCSQD